MAHFAPLDDEKTEVRRLALDRRDGLPAASRYAAANAVAARPLPVAAASSVVSGYIPIRSEFDPQPLMRRFAESGARLALPCVVARGAPLVMRAWRFGEPLVSGQWGLREPAPGSVR